MDFSGTPNWHSPYHRHRGHPSLHAHRARQTAFELRVYMLSTSRDTREFCIDDVAFYTRKEHPDDTDGADDDVDVDGLRLT